MFINPSARILGLLVGGTLLAAGCGSETAGEPAVPSSTAVDSISVDIDPVDAVETDDLATTYESFGNPDADVVIINTQGGPAPELDAVDLRHALSIVDQDRVFVVNVHQAQTLDPDRFLATDLSFEEAKAADVESVEMLAAVVEHFVAGDSTVYVLGSSFGAFMTQELLATQGNIADGYLMMVGRLDIPEELWEPFSEGRSAGFVRGTEIVEVPIEAAGMGADTEVGDRNMSRLAAGLGHHRYTERLDGVVLDNVAYVYGETDEQVGRLTPGEIDALEQGGATVFASEGGHSAAVDEFLVEGLLTIGLDPSILVDSTEPSAAVLTDRDIGSVTLDGASLDIEETTIADPADLGLDAASIGRTLSELALVGVAGDTLVVVPLSESGEEATGTIVVADGAEIWIGDGFDVDQRDGFVVSDGHVSDVTTASAESVPLSFRLGFGMGTSAFVIDGSEATVTGDLGSRTYDQVRFLIDEHPEVDTIVLQQVNGSVNDEVNVLTAALIREAGYTTRVPADGEIYSGGVDLFAAGATRIAEPGATIGVHAWCCGPAGEGADALDQAHPAHRDQLALFTSLMGDKAGRAFYFYTLQAAQFESIEEMTPAELDLFDVVSADDVLGDPVEVAGADLEGIAGPGATDLSGAVEATRVALEAASGEAETLVVVDLDATAIVRTADPDGTETFWTLTFADGVSGWAPTSAVTHTALGVDE